MALDFLFGKRKTPEEMLKQNQRALNRAMRCENDKVILFTQLNMDISVCFWRYNFVYEFCMDVFCTYCRDLDRERAKLEGQEKKIIADIKKMAKQGQMVIIVL